MLYAFGFERYGVVVSDLYHLDPNPGKGQEGPERGVRLVDALLTGLHEPRSSHLLMLEALATRDSLRAAYAAALQQGYLWHEFGDLHLILP